jgi:hypothetical protein
MPKSKSKPPRRKVLQATSRAEVKYQLRMAQDVIRRYRTTLQKLAQ